MEGPSRVVGDLDQMLHQIRFEDGRAIEERREDDEHSPTSHRRLGAELYCSFCVYFSSHIKFSPYETKIIVKQ